MIDRDLSISVPSRMYSVVMIGTPPPLHLSLLAFNVTSLLLIFEYCLRGGGAFIAMDYV